MNVAADMGIPYDSEEFAEENHYESDRSYDELSFVTHEDPIDLEKKFEDRAMDSTDVINSPSFTKETWIGDTGASTTTTNDDSGMFDVRFIDEKVKAFPVIWCERRNWERKSCVFNKKMVIPPCE